MPAKYSAYAIYPGRQIVVSVIPRKYQHAFFEGVQSFDYTPNTEDITHGQYGFTSDVITLKEFRNITGTIGLKDFNNGLYMMRVMSGQDPDVAFVFDPAFMEHCDLISNKFDKAKTTVVASLWVPDFLAAPKYASQLDDIETRDIDYAAPRVLEFDGKQAIIDSFVVEAPSGYIGTYTQTDFVLSRPALTLVDHELCPIPYALRVWVAGTVLSDPTEAVVHTHEVAGQNITTVTLTTPAKAGDIVKVLYLIDGANPVLSQSLSQGPLMVESIVNLTGEPATWDNTIDVYLSKPIKATAVPNVANFRLMYTSGTAVEETPSAVEIVDVSNLVLRLTFTGSTWPAGATAAIVYTPTSAPLVQDTAEPPHVSPGHSIPVAAY